MYLGSGSLRQGPLHGFRVAFDDRQQDAGSAVGKSAALFPVLHGAGVEAEPIGKLLAAQLHALAERQDALGGRVVDDATRQIDLAPHMGEHLAQGILDLATHLGAFCRYLRFSSFLIRATSFDQAFLSSGFRSSRSDLA